MRTRSRKSGFSLVELLTVIAIIAILAAIIFPVMNAVRQRAQETDCMTRLHQLELGLRLYKTDNRKFPPVLCAAKKDIAGNLETFENAKGDYLYAEYVKTIRAFHCPASKVTSTAEWATYPSVPYDPDNSGAVIVYAYDSFDCQVSGIADSGTGQYPNAEQHYALDWAPNPAYLAPGGGGPPADIAAGTSASVAQYDYERQLKFKTPPDDTVITWCSNHSNGDRSLVVFLDGHVGGYQGRVANSYKWRIRQKKE